MISQKGFFDDLTEGKFSYPVSHAIWTQSKHKDNIVEMLKLKTEDNAVKAYVATCLKDSGSLAHTRKVVEGLDVRARALLRDVKVPNPMLEGLLDKLSEGLKACR
jgi:geranylgeranyl diphosphate synthase type 3